LTKFLVEAEADVEARIKLDIPGEFWNAQHQLTVTVFDEDGHARFQDMLAKGSLCDDRIKQAFTTQGVGPANQDIRINWENDQDTKFYYFYALDCKLEWYKAPEFPELGYSVDVQTSSSGHLPSDEQGLLTFNTVMAGVLLILFCWFAHLALVQINKQGIVHLFFIILMAAYSLQIIALVCESLHLFVYNRDGKGLRWQYSLIPMDFISEMSQGASEHIIALLLVFLASGWTTISIADLTITTAPSSVGQSASAASSVLDGDQSLMGILSKMQAKFLKKHPVLRRNIHKMIRTFGNPFKKKDSGVGRITLGTVFIATTTFIELVLEMFGRTYHDHFSQFHDHEHWPGKMIIVMRIAMWVAFIVGSGATYAASVPGSAMQKFTTKISLLGSIWLLAFPVTVFMAERLPPRFRNQFVVIGSVLLQAVALQYLMYLSLFSQAFQQVSSVSDPRKSSALPSSTSQGKQVNGLGRKFKVALD